MNMKKIGILTSGGDAPGMNAAIRAVVRTAASLNVRTIGFLGGYEGLMKGEMIELLPDTVSGWTGKGGTWLRTSRSREFHLPEGLVTAATVLINEAFDGLIVLGGDGTFRGAADLRRYLQIPIVGIPCTIDKNVEGTEGTIGFDSALNGLVMYVEQTKNTAGSHSRTYLIEVMGNGAPHLTIDGACASGADGYIIEKPSVKKLKQILSQTKNSQNFRIIFVLEGDKPWERVKKAEMLIRKAFPHLETKIQRPETPLRGNFPSAADRLMATSMGELAVTSLLKAEGDLFALTAIQNGRYLTVPLPDKIDKIDKP